MLFQSTVLPYKLQLWISSSDCITLITHWYSHFSHLSPGHFPSCLGEVNIWVTNTFFNTTILIHGKFHIHLNEPSNTLTSCFLELDPSPPTLVILFTSVCELLNSMTHLDLVYSKICKPSIISWIHLTPSLVTRHQQVFSSTSTLIDWPCSLTILQPLFHSVIYSENVYWTPVIPCCILNTRNRKSLPSFCF